MIEEREQAVEGTVSGEDASPSSALLPLEYYARPRRQPRQWMELALAMMALAGALLVFLGMLFQVWARV